MAVVVVTMSLPWVLQTLEEMFSKYGKDGIVIIVPKVSFRLFCYGDE